MKYPGYSGIILAGGLNSRYNGKDKAFIEVNGKPIIDRTLDTFSPFFEETIIITNSPEHYSDRYTSCVFSSDHYQKIGPLAGIHAAMKVASKDFLFIVSCDMPWIQPSLIQLLLDTHRQQKTGNLIPSPDDKMEPLHAIYDRAFLPVLEKHIEEGGKRSIRSFLEKVDTQFYTSPDILKFVKSFININSPEDFNKYRHLSEGI